MNAINFAFFKQSIHVIRFILNKNIFIIKTHRLKEIFPQQLFSEKVFGFEMNDEYLFYRGKKERGTGKKMKKRTLKKKEGRVPKIIISSVEM